MQLQSAARGAEEEGSEALSRQRAYKLKFQEGVALFNKKPRKGIELLQSEGILGPRCRPPACWGYRSC